MDLDLGDVQTTALIPVAVKASESLRKNARIHDDAAVKVVKTLNLATEPYDKFMSHEGVIARTLMLDRMVNDFVAKNPDAAIINLGAGFDNRFSRVDNGSILWFDVDFPDSIELRKKIFAGHERVTMIAGNILDASWCGKVKEGLSGAGRKILFLAEGLFMYFTMEEIRQLLSMMKESFPGATLIAEQNNPMMVKNQKYHDTVKNTNAEFKSGTWSGNEIAALVDGIRMTEEHSFNEEMRKHSFCGWLFAMLLPKMNNRWARFEW